jgi:peroxidase
MCLQLNKFYLFFIFITYVYSQETKSCEEFLSIINAIEHFIEIEESRDDMITNHDIGCGRNENTGNIFLDSQLDGETYYQSRFAKVLTTSAQIFRVDCFFCPSEFDDLAKKCIKQEETWKNISKSHPKYRSIDGRGNNLKNPDWGATDTPFSRFAPKNYEDGIYSIKKSVTGNELPNPRLIVQEVLKKAVISTAPSMNYNLMAILLVLFITHDIHYQVPVQAENPKNGINCCTKGNSEVFPQHLSHSACLPISISKTDPNFKGQIGCQNFVRSQLGKYPKGVETGEILNRVTSYLDLSLVYGSHESELNKIRLFKGGKLRLSKNNVLPVDKNGKYLPSMLRFTATPIASIWPAIFSRNHNHLAKRLEKLNPSWDDETVFQEARRINIAVIQFNLITTRTIERIFKQSIDEKYSPDRKTSTSLEFALAYRAGHYYTPTNMIFENKNGIKKEYLQSDTVGRSDLIENGFNEALRGALNQGLNVQQFSEEIISKIGKDKRGFGLDLIGIDIQRGRDHGIPSFAEIRRRCNLKPEIKTFDDFKLIFNKTQSNVDLLKNIYESAEDVDFYVGGLLEIYENLANPLAGETFGCVIGNNYRNVMGGDIYFYTHPENPYPFTKKQIAAIQNYPVPNLFCTNSELKEMNKLWPYVPHQMNPKESCSSFPPIDLSAWKES